MDRAIVVMVGGVGCSVCGGGGMGGMAIVMLGCGRGESQMLPEVRLSFRL